MKNERIVACAFYFAAVVSFFRQPLYSSSTHGSKLGERRWREPQFSNGSNIAVGLQAI